VRECFVAAFSSVLAIGTLLSLVYQNIFILGAYFFAALLAGSLAVLLGTLLSAC